MGTSHSQIPKNFPNCSHSNYLEHCKHIEEKKDGSFHQVAIKIMQYDILDNKKHKGLWIQPGTNLNNANLDFHCEISATAGFRPVIQCDRCSSAHEDSGYGPYHLWVNQSIFHNFCEHYHRDTARYNVYSHNCQVFVWFMLFSHGVPESSLRGIIEFDGGHVSVETRDLANRCLEIYNSARGTLGSVTALPAVANVNAPTGTVTYF